MFKIPFLDTLVAIVITVVLLFAWNFLVENPKIKKAATEKERLAWEVEQSRLRKEMQVKLRKAEAELDDVIKSYLNYTDEEYDRFEEVVDESDLDNSCVIPDSVSDRLNKIGRSRKGNR